ncbi:hypothetical protein BSKO_05091 [Bryopsis sp. KO-2023]|nr:hypothetical protein BSKO_05091 [Bryopsis sp. KO-2023]
MGTIHFRYLQHVRRGEFPALEIRRGKILDAFLMHRLRDHRKALLQGPFQKDLSFSFFIPSGNCLNPFLFQQVSHSKTGISNHSNIILKANSSNSIVLMKWVDLNLIYHLGGPRLIQQLQNVTNRDNCSPQ